MPAWNKDNFTEHMRENCSREVAKVGESIINFSESHAADISWGRGAEHGTLTYRCNSDEGHVPLFHMTSLGQLNLQINFMRRKFDSSLITTSRMTIGGISLLRMKLICRFS